MEFNFSKISNKINKLPISGKVLAGIKIFLFIDIAVIIGLWLGIKLFFPNDFVLSKVNEQLFLKDLALLSEDIDISLVGNIAFEDGTLMQKGEKVLTFSKLSFSPAIFATLGGHPAGTIYVEDMNAQGGELEASFETNANPCYTFNSNEVPLSILKPFLGEMVLTGALTGDGEICRKDNKYNGKIDLKGDDIVLRGKVPTPMGDFDVGKIILGEIELLAEITDNKAEIKHFTVKGVFELNALGKITLNTKNFLSSRLDLNIKTKVPDMAKIEENVALNLLVSQLSQYKGDEENSFALTLRGFLNKPQTGKILKERDFKNENRPKRLERPQKIQRQPAAERLPQKMTPNNVSPDSENQKSAKTEQQNDELKKKEDELKRKEDELRQKEEDAKEREEKMREEREQREREEKERREQEEKKRIEEEERIHAAQEEAMNEIRRAREEIEAERSRNNPPKNENEEEMVKPANDEKEEEE